MRRYTITEGAKTTAGGTVVTASSSGYIHGARIALENDAISCKACGRSGYIQCVGPRLVELWNGVAVALENDLCICACTPPPRLIANQTVRGQEIGGGEAHGHSDDFERGVATVATASMATYADMFDLHFLVRSEVTGQPLTDWPYVIELASGGRIEGKTDKNGRTQRRFKNSPETHPVQ